MSEFTPRPCHECGEDAIHLPVKEGTGEILTCDPATAEPLDRDWEICLLRLGRVYRDACAAIRPAMNLYRADRKNYQLDLSHCHALTAAGNARRALLEHASGSDSEFGTGTDR